VSFPELADRTVTITNGFDAADFAGRVPERTDDKFRIVHSGYLHTGEGDSYGAWMRGALGGEILGVDTSTRSHVYLLETVRGLMENEPSLRGVIEVHLAGVTSEADRAAARDYDFVRFAGYLPHAESVALIRSADLLFLPMQNLRAGARAGIIPGKTYEYLATGNPILAAVPEGDARDIVRQAGTGLVCDPDDVAVMSTIIREQVRRWRHGAPSPPLDERYVTRFERQTLTATLAGVFTRVARREPVKDADGFAGERASVRLERVG
jgi:glycosyltransferase involved in cell wall biosynthesis